MDPPAPRALRALLAKHTKDTEARKATASARQAEAETIVDAHLARLRAFRVLDPACGSGNFLYVALVALKDLERAAILEAEALGLPPRPVAIGPEVVLGLEINAFAVELARVSVWIGALQWTIRNGQPILGNPILKSLDTIEHRDALLNEDGTPAAWPRADAIVGNPPFLGDKAMIRGLGESYVTRLRTAYAGRVPGGADLVCYWFEKAREAIELRQAQCAGLVATNSIRGGANRKVLERIVGSQILIEAWSDEPWSQEGAAVRVSIACFAPQGSARLNGVSVPAIAADLTGAVADTTTAQPLSTNSGVASVGPQKNGDFDIPGDLARQWLTEPTLPNGKSYGDVLRPISNGVDLVRRGRDVWIIDFGASAPEAVAAGFPLAYAYVERHVRPMRLALRRDAYVKRWWIHAEPRPLLRRLLLPLARFIATPRVAKHRVFAWIDARVLPDHQLVAIARDDDTTFGILHSRFHEAWALRLGTSLEDRPRYTPTTTFETFPFPDGLTPDLPAATYAADPRAVAVAEAARDLVAKRDAWLNPPDWVERVPEIVPGYPDRLLPRPGCEARLRTRTLTALYNTRSTPEGAWLDALHARLDAAVAAAYGWPADIPEPDALAALLALNLARAPARPAAA